ncbi:MAG: SDR family oxidoreductase [Methanomicrobiales archaeon]|nr:SDR family oxidoreductase [Methanomicrobiales archaeon]MDI6876415.1 SDR family oxidoreductase [Methanomicrobiales archaeon]
MQFVVTGGAGFIGSHLSEALRERGDVIILDDLSSGKEANIRHLLDGDRVRFIEGSVTDLHLLQDVFRGTDCIFHQAAIASVPRSVADPIATHAVNATGTLNVLVAARDAGVPKVVLASSSAVYGDDPTLPKHEGMLPNPLSPYAAQKATGEYYASAFSALFGLRTVCLRYFNVYGPRQDPASEYAAVIPKFTACLLAGEPPLIHGEGSQTRDFVFVQDVVRANIAAMESDATGIFNIAGGTPLSVNDLARMIQEILGTDLEPVHGAARPGDIRDSYADIARARERLGWRPRYPLKEGLARTVDWFAAQRQASLV